MWNKNKILVTVLVSLLLLGFINIFNITRVFALPQVNNTCVGTVIVTATATCVLTIANSGDLVIVGVSWWVSTASCPPAISSNSTGGGESYSYIANSGCQYQSVVGNQVLLSKFIASSSSSHTVSVTISSTTNLEYLAIFGFDTSGTSSTVVATASCLACATGGTGTYTTSSSPTFGSPSILIAVVNPTSAAATVGAGSGFTLLSHTVSIDNVATSEYGTTTSVSSPSNFPWSINSYSGSGTHFTEEGAILGASSTVTQPLTICTQEAGQSPLGIIIPLYESPNADWTTIENDAVNNPSIKFTVIVNPANGAGNSQQSIYTNGINTMQSDGVRVLGYVYTQYSHRAQTTVQNDISAWTSFYPQINGIFFDQVGNTAGNRTYYINLVTFASNQHYTSYYTVANPGISVSNGLYNIFSDLNIWEKPGTPSTTILALTTANPPSSFGFISNGIASSADTNSTYLTSVSAYVNNIFITSSNAYTSLPSYFATLVSNVASVAIAPPQGTFALSGASPSPSTLLSNNKGSCTSTNITVTPSSTLTVTVPADGTYTIFRMNSTSTSPTTENISTCASGTCTAKQVDTYYEVENSYAAQALNPVTFNGNTNIMFTGTLAGAASTQGLAITNVGTVQTGNVFFDFGSVTSPKTFTINGLIWNSITSNILPNVGGNNELFTGYIQSGGSTTTNPTKTITSIIALTVTVTVGTSTCSNINDCSANQFGSFLSFLLPALILIGMFEYLAYAMHITDERVYVFIFMIVVSAICYASSLQAFGNFGIPWYIGIFVDIVGFMLIITYQRDRGITSSE